VEQVQKLFNYNENPIRTVLSNGQIWFVAKDVCEILGISKHRDAVSRLTGNQRGSVKVDTLGGAQEMAVINEPGVYKLVFRSKKPEAEKFTDWIAEEVLPSIRKHGAYMTDNALAQAIGNPDFMIGLLSNLKAEQERSKALEIKTVMLTQQVAEDKPKVTYYDTILESSNAVNIGQIAEDYGLNARQLNQILKEEYVQRRVGRQWILYQQYRNKGLTKSKTFSVGQNGSRIHTQWTQKGRLFIHDLLARRGITPADDIL
jgi:anti-repressor protein